jgi:hypothetical protein
MRSLPSVRCGWSATAVTHDMPRGVAASSRCRERLEAYAHASMPSWSTTAAIRKSRTVCSGVPEPSSWVKAAAPAKAATAKAAVTPKSTRVLRSAVMRS